MQRKRNSSLFSALAAGALALSGCAYGELKQVLRAQVAAETSCPDVTIEGTSMYQPGYKPGQYRVKGCGIDRTYDCPPDDGLLSYGDKVCTYVDAKAAAKPLPPAPPGAADEPMMDEPAPLDEPMAEPPAENAPAEGGL